jgi:hypothetical protein
MVAFIDKQNVPHLESPERGHNGLFSAYPFEGKASIGVIFIVENPASRHGSVENESHYQRPLSRAESSSATATGPFLLRREQMVAKA